MEPLRVNCPECGGELLVDSRTGVVLSHRRRGGATATKDLDELFRDLDEGRQRAEQVFEQERRAWEDRDRLLEERFKEAVRRVEADPDSAPPRRPFDLD
jgi:hypothetical protein